MNNPFDELEELISETGANQNDLTLPREPRASRPSIEYAYDLLEKCDRDLGEYDLEEWSQADVSELIDELKDELGWE